jgi:hypothetical protein
LVAGPKSQSKYRYLEEEFNVDEGEKKSALNVRGTNILQA